MKTEVFDSELWERKWQTTLVNPTMKVKVKLLKQLQEGNLEKSAQLTNIAIWLNCSLERGPEKEEKRQHTWPWKGKSAFPLMSRCDPWLQNREQRTQLTSRFMQQQTTCLTWNQWRNKVLDTKRPYAVLDEFRIIEKPSLSCIYYGV